jgi:hypothetical protein
MEFRLNYKQCLRQPAGKSSDNSSAWSTLDLDRVFFPLLRQLFCAWCGSAGLRLLQFLQPRRLSTGFNS